MTRMSLCSSKMAEDSQRRKDDLPPPPSARHQPGPEDIFEPDFQKFLPSQLSKEELYEQRQKCELKRLLKHTHPELKMLDEVVDEELAEVLGSEIGVTAGETGYEGEVLSRRLIFENCADSHKVSPYNPKMHMAERTLERGNVSKTPAVFEKHGGKESVQGINEGDKTLYSSQDTNTECEEEMIRIDVQATRRKFENQSMNTSRLNPDKEQNEKRGIKKQKKSGMCSKESLTSQNKGTESNKSLDLVDQTRKHWPCSHIIGQSTEQEFSGMELVSSGETIFEDAAISLPDPENSGEIIKTNAALFQNNPFIPTNIEREHSFVHTSKSENPTEDSEAAQNHPIANVKTRTHVFESMPFHKIRQQNKDEIETMVENIKETLNSLHRVKAIHSGGSIIEVHETMIAKKAKFKLSEKGPEINYDEVAEGGAQNFILQLLPRANLKPQITYLKEGSNGSMEATMVSVPVHQHHYNTNHDTEFKTANVVQVVEDILNQDNSLRKGVIIQEDVDRYAEVIVYSLYNYFDKEDVKSYCPPINAGYDELETETQDVSRADIQELQKGFVKSTTSSLLEMPNFQTRQESIRPEITVMGNVKLFKSCIEKGDLEYLKTLQAEPTVQEQELPPNQNLSGQGMELHPEQRVDKEDEGPSEWVPVDVKKLKNMFSGDGKPIQPKLSKYMYENHAQSTNIPSATTGQIGPLPVLCPKIQSSTECNTGVVPQVKNAVRDAQTQEEACNSPVAPQGSYLHLKTQDSDMVHQAEVVEAVDDNDEITDLQAAIHSLQQATIDAKSIYHSSQEKQASNVKLSRIEAENADQKVEPGREQRWDELPSASNFTSEHKSDLQNTERCHKVQTTETCSEVVVPKQNLQAATVSVHSSETSPQQEDEEVVFEGKLKAALDSLERSNINVTRGDFRAAMIYRNSSKPHKELSQTVDIMSVEKATKEEFSPVTEPKPTQAPLRQEASKKQVTTGDLEPPSQSENPNKPATRAALERSGMPAGPKPVIPPKPKHLKFKQRDIQLTNTKNPEEIQPNIVRPKETAPQPSVMLVDHSGLGSVDQQGKELFDGAIKMSQGIKVGNQDQGAVVTLENDNTNKNTINSQQEINAKKEEKSPNDLPIKDNMSETDESHVDFHEACKKFEGKKAISVKNPPVKPKRVKIAQPENKNPKHISGDINSSSLTHNLSGPSNNNPNSCGQTGASKDAHKQKLEQESKVAMREKKGRTETEDERRQRLSVHMDEIMRGNIMAAMEIFDNLRKQEELQNILCRVEEIEEDTSEVDVRSLRGVFENVPDWVVCSNKKKQRKEKVESKEDSLPPKRDNSESKSSMAHVFGDLERASEEIMNLKEQTLARLMDIEETIKKALYSVSTLKSDSDIAGLSCLFKESLGTVQGSPSSGNIRKISIGSSRTKSQPAQGSLAALGNAALPVSQSAKQQASPPSSPAFISIQSAARKTDKTEVPPQEKAICPTCQHNPKTEEKFRTTKTVTCNSPAQNRKREPRKGGKKQSPYGPCDPKQELSVLDVQTGCEGNGVIGTKTVTENYERTDNFGNRFYSAKTSTVVTTQPETITSTGQAVTTPAMNQVTTYPEVRLPINQKH
uniref:xin actin-binding repeat-containing protein 1-like n=1 Tax=Semicossyphus pulcher TaxID=241346 RepID=UPI0037E8E15C